MRFREWMQTRFVTPDAVYGLVLYSALVAATSDDSSDSLEVLLVAVFSLVVFWGAHVFAGTVAAHGDIALTRSFTDAVRHSSGMLYAALLPSLPLVLGAFGILPTAPAVSLSLLVAMIVFFVLGYWSLARRGSPVVARILGGLGTSLLGLLMIVLDYTVH